uniref:FAB light chain n=1 Tax=Mus musculus TaxID=10090 RepID=UPI002493CFFA|nr:Chain B, FAB light chain [Mus musculus]8D2T_B Chain B, FAB light chain [Mus musculus]8D2U_B Chain B, FAB light chain [Mus musculus]8D2V_B Chain B, FAB light chain [Mus musculus]8D2W_B Chain B, FAB light chain [Mus musculus]8D2X_B Chain B, FAB light chain [Mus musculus]
ALDINSPEAEKNAKGARARITCNAGNQVGSAVAWFNQRPGDPASLLTYWAATEKGVAGKQSAQGASTKFSMSSAGPEAPSLSSYWCLLFEKGAFSFGGSKLNPREGAGPQASILPPSADLNTSGGAAVVCFLPNWYGNITVQWKTEAPQSQANMSWPGQAGANAAYAMAAVLAITKGDYGPGSFTCNASNRGTGPFAMSLN